MKLLKKLHPLVWLQIFLIFVLLAKAISVLILQKFDKLTKSQALEILFPIDIFLIGIVFGLTIYVSRKGFLKYKYKFEEWGVYACFFIGLVFATYVSYTWSKPEVIQKQSLHKNFTKAECVAFYDEKTVLSQEEHKKRDDAEIVRLENEGNLEEAWKLSLASLNPLLGIADKTHECGQYDERFFETQVNLCSMFAYGQENWGADGRKHIFENYGKIHFCDPALQRGDEKAFIHVLRYYLAGLGGEKNYKLAVQHIEAFQKNHPESRLIAFAAPIYQRGGFGLEKNEKKAFEIIKAMVEQNSDGSLTCDLSLYYKNGIGTDENEQKAQKWLAVYKEHNADKECEFTNFEVLFEDWEWGYKKSPSGGERDTNNAQ